jgi:hypothetical protein
MRFGRRDDDRSGQGLAATGIGGRVGRAFRAHSYVVAAATDAGTLKAEIFRLDPVHAAQIVQIFRTRSLMAAFIGREQRLSQFGQRLPFHLVERLDLGDHIGQRDTQREALRFHPAEAEGRSALVVDFPGDLSRRPPMRQPVCAYFARYVGFFQGGFRHPFRPPHRCAGSRPRRATADTGARIKRRTHGHDR